jgi:hypothetical protein
MSSSRDLHRIIYLIRPTSFLPKNYVARQDPVIGNCLYTDRD